MSTISDFNAGEVVVLTNDTKNSVKDQDNSKPSDRNTRSSCSYCINFDDVQAAANRIKGVAHYTPVLTSGKLDEMVGGRNLFFKVEAWQKTGSFKFRGALNAIKALIEEEQQRQQQMTQKGDSNMNDDTLVLPVVTHSSGNHAQAVALAAKLCCTNTRSINNGGNSNHRDDINDNNNKSNITTNGTESQSITVNATLCMPDTTPRVKLAAVKAYGGNVVVTAATNEAREVAAAQIQQTTGAHFVHPSEDPRVIAGQGTVCLELHQQMQEFSNKLDVVIIPVGGGGLAAGNTIALRALMGSSVKIVLAEPIELNDAYRSFYSRQLLQHEPDNPLDSVADGLKTTLGPNTWPIIRDNVDDIITVSELDILQATKLVWERLKVCIEASAGVGVAVALSNTFAEKYPIEQYKNVGIVLCGGNVDVLKLSARMQKMGL